MKYVRISFKMQQHEELQPLPSSCAAAAAAAALLVGHKLQHLAITCSIAALAYTSTRCTMLALLSWQQWLFSFETCSTDHLGQHWRH